MGSGYLRMSLLSFTLTQLFRNLPIGAVTAHRNVLRLWSPVDLILYRTMSYS
jgi:hypothetical protein